MDARTFSAAMGGALPLSRYEALLPAWNACLIQAGCTTVKRVAMISGQVGHESLGLKYMREVWGPTPAQKRYEGRRDLGNVIPGDGEKFAGHGPLQVTGRANHAAVSRWAFDRGYVPSSTYFVDHPDELAGDRYGFLGVVWYWTVARSKLNAYSDADDLLAATKAINGGTNGLADRKARWERCLKLGVALLPTSSAVSTPAPKGLPEMIERRLVKGSNVGRIACPTGSVSGLVAAAWVSATAQGGVKGRVLFQKSANADGPPPGSGPAWDLSGKNAARVWEDIPSGTEYLEYWIDAGGEGSLLIEQKAK